MSPVEKQPSENDIKPKVTKRRFVGKKPSENLIVKDGEQPLTKTTNPSRHINRVMNQIPDDILNDSDLNEAIKLLPSNYNFEIHKTVWNIKKNNATRVAVQMPEGLLIYSLIISDILESFCNVEVIVMGDVSYGACCIDDYTARSLDCDFIVHYAHSCLVPIDITSIKVLYVFVTINIDETHLINTIKLNFERGSQLAIFGTIQFNPTIHSVKAKLETDSEKPIYLIPPQTRPLSKGELLGCTSARLDSSHISAMIYVGDGRFHLESSMIHNPDIPAYRYDPYSRKFTREYYDQKQMIEVRKDAISTTKYAKKVGLILGALGRQGNPITLDKLEKELTGKGIQVVKIILSEILPQKIAMFDDIDAFVQVACPRLSIDWGYAFNKPLLTPYEAMVMLEKDTMGDEKVYPMDYYAKDGYGRGHIPDHSSI
ncbi:Diphthamide biosynthesis protein 1 [Candida maltosa Xu316]|uniref:2-(3-amino-3-carboxypropyl)histidine synthase subunit 1 n=1 Tax=Candida maltosa (strain Xu316) TaxID=1245528 RepID=M3IVL0_CANMX|nr:Diphthamide biosynthesis protein 1 [Candida maltosa Xu316]